MENTIASRATRKEWIGLIIIALPCIVYAMDLTVLNLAVPFISADLKPKSSELLWIIDIYGFMVAGMLITMGTLGDKIGRRKLLMIGAAFFAITSVIAAFSTSAIMLIIARALLGLAGATVAPSTLSLIRNMFPDEKQRTFAIGVWITSYSVGGAIGPLVGGTLLDYYSWQSVFLVSVPVMILLLITAPFLLPEYKDPNAGKLDLLSAGQSIAAILSVIFGLKKIAEEGLTLQAATSIVMGVVFTWLFIRRQNKLSSPLIDLKLFRIPRFSISLLAYMTAAFVSFGGSVFLAQYLQLVIGLSPLRAGLWMLPWTIGFIIGSLLTPFMIKYVRPVKLMTIGFIAAAIGYAIIMQLDTLPTFVVLVTGSLITSISMAPVFTLTTDFILNAAPPEKTGAASAISETSAEMGGALGIAILGSIGTAIYRLRLSSGLSGSVPRSVIDASEDTLGAALNEAQQLKQNGDVLRRVAQESFTDALQIILLVSAVLSAILAIIIYLKLARVKKS
ncbi:MAG: MFS transporter [Chitinophagaceae bacterium]|nr:MAG: MFS transporter [Chitinophagaceae bacterium]